MDVRAGFVEALLAAPTGVALLARLEAEVRADVPWFAYPVESDALAVAAAAEAVHARTWPSLLTAILDVAEDVGPWRGGAVDHAAAAHRNAGKRLPIAEAIDERFGEALHAPLDPAAQEWWTSGDPPDEPAGERLRRWSLDDVYEAGQFTWGGLWTVTSPPVSVHDELTNAWSFHYAPVSRWRLPVRADARVHEVHRPADWADLVTRFPAAARPGCEWWQLPGETQDQVPDGVAALMGIPGQRAARTSIRRHLVPDWAAVAEAYHGIHLSWAGVLTAHGCVTDLGDGDVALLLYWDSERTHWLADAFGEPEPIAGPQLADWSTPQGTVPASVDVRIDTTRRLGDEQVLRALLGR